MFGSIAKVFTGSKDTYINVKNETSEKITVDVPSVDPFDWQSEDDRPDKKFSDMTISAGSSSGARKCVINTGANGNMVKMYINVGGFCELAIRFDQGKAASGEAGSVLKSIESMCEKAGEGIAKSLAKKKGGKVGSSMAGSAGSAAGGAVGGTISAMFSGYAGQVKIDDCEMYRIGLNVMSMMTLL